MTSKHISQLISADGKPEAHAISAPGCFVHDDVPVEGHDKISWGKVFSEPCRGNAVDFYVTGAEYFAAVAQAIAKARKTIFIAGWQVNFDVELHGGRTLYQYLESAIDANPALRVYVMPWLSPKVPLDTGDFETMLAVFQLNAGLPPPMRAFALPAIAQSDMPDSLGIGFSHHQKLVVIDEERAFVGGIDLAYGRRDDGRFSLAHEGRVGSEVYNSCVPAIHELSKVEQVDYLTKGELLCSSFDGMIAKSGAWWESATAKPIAAVMDLKKSGSDFSKDKQQEVTDWWDSTDLMPEFVRALRDVPLDVAQKATQWTYRRVNKQLNGKLDRLWQTGTAHVNNAPAVLVAWLSNARLEQLRADLRGGAIRMIECFIISAVKQLSVSADKREKRYENLRKLRKLLPASGKVIATSQPRMPWHDVHSSIRGPAVSDLSRNFIRRWNGIAHRYEHSYTNYLSDKNIAGLCKALGFQPTNGVRLPRLAATISKNDQKKAGKSWVQVLRSAPATMQRDEMNALPQAHASKLGALVEQNNCLKAMLTAIHGSQQFIYIEGQFFQSAYGIDSTVNDAQAAIGPMQYLTDVTALPDYKKYAKRLGIYGASWEEVPARIIWSQYDDIARDIKGRGNVFISDLKAVLANIGTIKASQLMGAAQKRMLNPIGEALAGRIEKAIYDQQPFHVYMVLPVHPEGTLNTINIMTQLHLTMQSLIFGSESLVNRIRRALLAVNIKKMNKVSLDEARSRAKAAGIDELESEVGDGWKDFLTLLNLRNWEVLEKRPVTEQIYVHSKLLIADDRVAVLGSANINDRSQLGNRDSELAVIVRDDEQSRAKLDGVHLTSVSAKVHDLRMRLWKKIFGLMGAARPAHSLASVIEAPAATATWRAIQKIAQSNALAYQDAFQFLPHCSDAPSSIWPTWNKDKRALDYHMPFNERFWRDDEVRDVTHSWEAKGRAKEKEPAGIQGFIVALPETWTKGENNLSAMNLTMLAKIDATGTSDQQVASLNEDDHLESTG